VAVAGNLGDSGLLPPRQGRQTGIACCSIVSWGFSVIPLRSIRFSNLWIPGWFLVTSLF